jgi:hypothetical protein
MKMNRPVVREFITFLKSQLADPPWALQEQAAKLDPAILSRKLVLNAR